jgi:hypothetical protein
MGMEPFVAADDNAFGHLIASIPDPIKNLREALTFKANLQGQQADNQLREAQVAQIGEKLSRAQMFQQDLQAVKSKPDAQAVSSLIMKYPEFADQLKSGWDVKDKAAKDADLTQLGELYSAAANGNWQLALKQAQARLEADKAAGQADPSDQAFVDQIQSASDGNSDAQKAVLTSIGTHLAAVAGPEHFATIYGALKGGYTLEAGATRYDENGHVVAQSPFIKGNDGTIYERDGANGSPTGTPAKAAPAPAGGDGGFDAAVATVLKHEGGYNPHDINGAPVNFGINQGANPGVDVKNLTRDEAAQIYKDKYWGPSNAASLPTAMQAPYFDTYVINPTRAQQFLKASGGDPNKFMTLRENWMQSLVAKDPAKYGPVQKAWNNRNADLRLAIAGGDQGNVQPSGQQAPAGYHVLVPGSNSPGDYRVLNDSEIKTRGLDPGQQYQLNTKTGQVTGLGQKSNSGDDVLTRYGIQPSETGPSVLAKLPANMASQVKALAEGRLSMPSSFALAKPYWQTMLQLTAQYDPTFDAANAPARKQAITQFTGMGKGAQIVGSVNRVANHLQLLWNESKRLAGPDTGFGPLNTALAATGQAFEPKDAAAYDTEVQFIAGELEKIARNSPGTVSGVDKIISNLSRKQSASTRESAIQAAVGIISGAVDPLKDQYNSAFTNGSARPNIPWVSPKAQQIYRNIGGVDMSLTDQNANTNASESGSSSAPVHVSSPQEAARLPSGTLFITPDGRTLRKK